MFKNIKQYNTNVLLMWRSLWLFAYRQIALADLIIMNKVDQTEEHELNSLQSKIEYVDLVLKCSSYKGSQPWLRSSFDKRRLVINIATIGRLVL